MAMESDDEIDNDERDNIGSKGRTNIGEANGRSKPDTVGENTGRWGDEEHQLFLRGLEMYGKGWKKIAGLIQTRTVVQIRTHAQKYFQKLAKAKNACLPMAHGDMSRLARFGGGFAAALQGGLPMHHSIVVGGRGVAQMMY